MTIRMELGDAGYDIVLERGCLSRAGELLELDRRVLIVTDEGVPVEYAEALADQCREAHVCTVPQGEGSKSFSALEGLLRELLRLGFDRSDCVCAVGGGMVGDLAGLAAALYMRGIDFFSLPTTVLAQVDSSIGGKTAIDLDGVKNIVGVFRQPKKVLADPDTLRTLTPRQTAEGLAEAVKSGLIGDEALFSLFETEDGLLSEPERVIAPSLLVKKAVVEADERETGLRKLLNFGHTIGHGIESVTGLPHGECVALGMLPMCAPPVRERLRPVLEKLGLPLSVRADPERVYAAMLHDKKMTGGSVTLVWAEAPGRAVLKTAAPESLRPGIEMVVKP